MRPLPEPKKKMVWLYLGLLLVAVALVLLLHRPARQDGPGPVPPAPGGSGGDTLDVALLYGPMSYYIYGDTLGGYNYDLLRLVSRQQGVPMKFWPVNSLDDALGLLASGRYDMLASLPEDAAFKGRLLFSEPLFLDRQVLVQRKGADGSLAVTSALDLSRDTVHIEKGSPIAGRIANLCREIGDTIYVAEHSDLSSELLTLKVQSGQMRYAVVNERIAKPLTEKFANLDISSPISFTQFQSVVTAPGDSALLRRLDTWLRQASATPEARTLRTRYFLP